MSTHATLEKMASEVLKHRGPGNEAVAFPVGGKSDGVTERGSLPIRPLPKQTQISFPVFVAPKAYVCVDVLDGFDSLNKLFSTLN